jgi:mevalonate kinase
MHTSPDQSYAASACAKIILLGEHAVVYGQPALAVPVSGVRARATARLGAPGGGITLSAPDLGEQPFDEESDDERAQALLLAARNAAQLVCPGPARPDLALTLSSQIPMARGMGSSAAVSAAIGLAVCGLYGLEIDSATLSALVYRTEALLHGAPSGVDNTVVAYERTVWFIRGQEPIFVPIGAPLHLLIADTGAPSQTKDTVAAVRRRREQAPAHIDEVCAGIGALVMQARRAATEGDLPGLGRAMCANHALLQSLAVSTPRLDAVVDAALGAGALGAKLTGGGGGGCAVALVTDDSVAAVGQACQQAGAARLYETLVQPEVKV